MLKKVYIDCDETILYSRLKTENSISFPYRGITCYTSARPCAKEFLEALVAKGYDIYMMTQGVIQDQAVCLEAVGLRHYFKDIFGYDAGDVYTYEFYLGNIKRPQPEHLEGKWVLIDNCHSRDWRLAPKVEWLNAQFEEGKNFLKCEPYYGDGNPYPLTDLLPKLYNILDT